MVLNFIGNAVKFSDAGGTIDVTLQQCAENLLFEVKDTGFGIPTKDQTKIFDKFYRVYRPGKEIQGTGLGLSLAKQIVEAHNGIIKLNSTPNKGSLFQIFLPIIQTNMHTIKKINTVH
jgi:two-component system, OmpR family, sensor histidine kinase VicK